VDGSDFGIWNANRFSLNAAWCSGDFNADGGIDGSDFGIWNSFKFQSSDSSPRTPIARGSKLIVSIVSSDRLEQSETNGPFAAFTQLIETASARYGDRCRPLWARRQRVASAENRFDDYWTQSIESAFAGTNWSDRQPLPIDQPPIR
jgi:hypothetical protein